MPKQRVVAFVDGFNMYHSLQSNGLKRFKWVDYRSLAMKFIAPTVDDLTSVFYFSALAKWDTEKMEKHKTYMKALRWAGVEPILGNFKTVERKCQATCHQKYQTFEEKETDVNIAIYVVKMALQDEYDKALLFSADSDLIPAINTVQKVMPHKTIKVVFPFNRVSEHMRKVCLGDTARVKIKHLETSLFPDPIVIDAAKDIEINCPASWK
ncbi:MAG: NYN domain-containing protein [Humidesulfovibrio sp.]|uniref:NYN domain-containing protein n=1 Tax=Humidesulfovibrio sp. TaxID=2910988 RepID=UPI0027F56376|nr:NYN domain-containing protein [Humidesulfovibrio sp.]MDQ7836427.1 NYN domain-containing protein [Humidesulfovibrio sp.]